MRFVFPAVSAEGPAFWIVRTAPVSLRSFLWSKFWTGFVPILVMAVSLTTVSNHLLGIEPFLKVLTTVAIVFMTFALVGLAAGMGAQHPRFSAENLTQIAGSYGGIAYMVLAVLFIVVTVALLAWPASLLSAGALPARASSPRAPAADRRVPPRRGGVSVLTGLVGMRRGVRALEDLG